MNIENPSLISWSTPQHGDFNWGYSWISMECKWVYHGIMSITTGWSSDTYIYIYAYIFMGFWWRYSWTYNGNLQLTICDRDSMWGWIATTSLWPLMCLMNYHFPSFISGSSPANHILCRPEGRNFHELQNLVQTCASHILPATYECQEKTQSFYQGHHFATGGKKTWINSFWPKNYSICNLFAFRSRKRCPVPLQGPWHRRRGLQRLWRGEMGMIRTLGPFLVRWS